MSRSTRTLIAIMLWLLAGFVAANNIVLQTDLGAWLLPLILFTVALILALYPEGQARLGGDHDMLSAGATAAAHLPAASASSAPLPAPARAKASSGPDDLTVIEGIGPKMQGALRAAGIESYARMAQTSEDEFRAAIEAQGMRLAPSIPTWAEQAAFAARGDLEGLRALQATLKGGRRS